MHKNQEDPKAPSKSSEDKLIMVKATNTTKISTLNRHKKKPKKINIFPRISVTVMTTLKLPPSTRTGLVTKDGEIISKINGDKISFWKKTNFKNPNSSPNRPASLIKLTTWNSRKR